MSEVTWYFIKFFEQEEYADQFINGNLYLNRMSYFKKLENGKDDGRSDAKEAIAMWYRPHDAVIEFDVPGIGPIRLGKDELAGPVAMSFEHHGHLHIFCLYAVRTSGFALVDGTLKVPEDETDSLLKQVEIDERCSKLGPFAVIIRPAPFLAQLKAGLQRRGQWFSGRAVEYYDDETFHGEIPRADIPFKKQKRFSYENEYRVCLQTGTEGDDPISIDIGDISRVATKVQSSRLKDILQVKIEPAADDDSGPNSKGG